MGTAVQIFVDGMTFTECPRWHDGALWFIDFYTHAVYRARAPGEVEKVADVPQRPGGLGWLPDGRLLIVSSHDRRILRLEADGRLVEHADLSAIMPAHGNDMIVAPDGTAYVGNLGFDVLGGASFETAALIAVAPDGSARVASEPLYFPNGSAIASDGALIVAESMGNRVSRFAIDPNGNLGPREDWALFGPLPQSRDLLAIIDNAAVGPDGLCIDAEDAVWIADCYHHRAIRVRPGGEIVDQVDTGDDQVYAVALGGEDGRTLFLCVAPNFYESERSTTTLGRILTARVSVPAPAL